MECLARSGYCRGSCDARRDASAGASAVEWWLSPAAVGSKSGIRVLAADSSWPDARRCWVRERCSGPPPSPVKGQGQPGKYLTAGLYLA
jgi:hypothetical protein